MIDLTKAKDLVLLLKDLTKDKGGVFILGLIIGAVPSIVIAVFIYNLQSAVSTSQIKSHERELNRYAKTEELLNKRLDSCDAKAQRMYLKGIEENINKDLLPVQAYKQAVETIKKDMVTEEQRILNRIEKKQAAIKKEMEVEE